jgi:hypothetical protein
MLKIANGLTEISRRGNHRYRRRCCTVLMLKASNAGRNDAALHVLLCRDEPRGKYGPTAYIPFGVVLLPFRL